jgi:hypothetical protein
MENSLKAPIGIFVTNFTPAKKKSGQKRQLPDIPLDSRVEKIMPVAIKVEAGGEKGDKVGDEEFWRSPR